MTLVIIFLNHLIDNYKIAWFFGALIGSLNNLKSSSVIALYLRNSNQIDVIEEEKILDILQNTNYSNHISVFSYVLHSFGYR